MKMVVVFGCFDGIHPGHRAFLKQARKLGDRLIAIVTRDDTFKLLKGRSPVFSQEDRRNLLLETRHVDDAVIGDQRLGHYLVLRQLKPQIVALGYDQDALHQDLEAHRHEFNFNFKIVRLKPYKPEKYHNSIIRRVKGEGFTPIPYTLSPIGYWLRPVDF